MKDHLKAGFLLPRSGTYPTLARDVIQGFKRGIQSVDAGHDCEIYIESVGLGTRYEDIHDAAQKLILSQGIDLAVGYFSPGITAPVREYFQQNAVPLVEIQLNTHPPVPAGEPGDHVIDLDLYRSTYLHGKYLAGRKARVAVVSSFYESGYGLLYALESGLQSEGGEISGRYIAPMGSGKAEFKATLEKIQTSNEIDTVFCFFNGKEAREFFAEAEALSLSERCTFATTCIAAQQLQGILRNFTLQSTGSWYKEDAEGFIMPDFIGLLGLEAGLAAAAIATGSPQNIEKQLRKTSPRYRNGADVIEEVAEIEYHPSGSVIKILHSFDAGNIFVPEDVTLISGWKNPYLCID